MTKSPISLIATLLLMIPKSDVEFASYDSIVKKYGEKVITRFELDRHGVAEISDDTQMSLFTAAGILLGMTRGFMRGVMGRIDTYCHWTYLDWLHTQEWTSRHKDARVDSWLMDVPELYSRRAPGNTCLAALHSIDEGREARNNSCGYGGGLTPLLDSDGKPIVTKDGYKK